MIFIIKVTTNKEEKAVDMISQRARKKGLNTYAVLRPHGLRGYILLEAEDRESAEESVFNLPYVKGIIGKTIGYDDRGRRHRGNNRREPQGRKSESFKSGQTEGRSRGELARSRRPAPAYN